MKKVSVNPKKHATEISYYDKKGMLPLTNEKIESYNNKQFFHTSKQ